MGSDLNGRADDDEIVGLARIDSRQGVADRMSIFDPSQTSRAARSTFPWLFCGLRFQTETPGSPQLCPILNDAGLSAVFMRDLFWLHTTLFFGTNYDFSNCYCVQQARPFLLGRTSCLSREPPSGAARGCKGGRSRSCSLFITPSMRGRRRSSIRSMAVANIIITMNKVPAKRGNSRSV